MSIYKKIFEAKKEIGKISKDSTNPFYKSKYFDINSLLDVVEPILEKHGLLLIQPIIDNKVITRIINVEDEGSIDSEITMPVSMDPQKLGSAITYYRRYTLQSLLGLQAEDDDANGTGTPVKKKQAAKSSKTAPEKNKDLPWLNRNTDELKMIEGFISDGTITSLDQITKFKLSSNIKEYLTKKL